MMLLLKISSISMTKSSRAEVLKSTKKCGIRNLSDSFIKAIAKMFFEKYMVMYKVNRANFLIM